VVGHEVDDVAQAVGAEGVDERGVGAVVPISGLRAA
jgi:hypothetical protein